MFFHRIAVLIPLILMVFSGLPALVSRVLAADADHLLLGEVVLITRSPVYVFGSPFIEIINPTAGDIDLGNVYLTDAHYAPAAHYYLITLSDPEAFNPGGGIAGDFHARFPDGYVLAAGDSLAVSISGSSEYQDAYGRLPDFELFEDDPLTPDDVPELLEVFPGSINAGLGGGSNEPELSVGSEAVILYTWDGMSDLVQDIDYLMWGTQDAVRVDKTGVTVGADTYLADTAVIQQIPVAPAGHGFRHAFRRIDADEGTEILSGGNGITGHDETSENLATTWQDVDVGVTGHGVPTPPEVWFPSAPIFIEVEQIPSVPYPGQEVAISTLIRTWGSLASVVFHYSVDGGPHQSVAGTDQGGNYWSGTVPGQAAGTEVIWYCEAVNDGGGAAVYPGGAPIYSAGWTTGPEQFWPAKLLITEICIQPNDAEFIEICNPGAEDVDLSNYYLTDAVYFTQLGYWRIGEGDPGPNTIGGGDYGDFQARFPEGTSLAAGDTIVVAVNGSLGFQNFFGQLPDLELYEDAGAPDGVPDMLPLFETADGNSIYSTESTPMLSNGGESVILYHWVEGDDLTVDIDMFMWGIGTGFLVDKTGYVVGGSTFAPDTPVEEQTPHNGLASPENSYHRIDPLEGQQIPGGSNGVLGSDETSEDLPNTFDVLPADPSGTGIVEPPISDWQDIWGVSGGELGSCTAHAWADHDGDGDQDLYLVNSSPEVPNLLMDNYGGGYFTPSDTPEVMDSGAGTGAAWGDVYGDGAPDLFVAGVGRNLLFSNGLFDFDQRWWFPVEDGGLTAVAQTAAGTWIDHDHNGLLELYVSNRDGANQLLDAHYGFMDRVPAPLELPVATAGFAWCDWDLDLDPDLCVTTAASQLVFLEQNAAFEFTTTTLPSAENGIACAWADFDLDGDFDVFVAHDGAPDRIYVNEGSVFNPLALPAEEHLSPSVGGVWGDFDNDGYEDLYVGYRGEPNRLLHNEGGSGVFTVVADTVLGDGAECSAVSRADVDRDGDLDLFVGNDGTDNCLLRNNLDNGKHWLQIELEGHRWGYQANRSAIGALIRVDAGGRAHWRFVGGKGSTGSSSLVQHFGLGDTQTVDRVTVIWPYRLPGGEYHTAVLENVAADQRLEIDEDQLGLSASEEAPRPLAFALLPCHPNPFNPLTTITFTLAEPVTTRLAVYDLRGRLVRFLVAGEVLGAGVHEVVWDGRDDAGQAVAAGVYACKLTAGRFSATRSMTLVK